MSLDGLAFDHGDDVRIGWVVEGGKIVDLNHPGDSSVLGTEATRDCRAISKHSIRYLTS